ncbi:MAG: COG1361 S-layer family protein [Aminipila sp.]
MSSKRSIAKRGLGISMAIAMVFLYSIAPGFMPTLGNDSVAYAVTNGGVKIETIGSPGGMQGDKNISVGFQIENNRDETVNVQNMTLSIEGAGININQNAGSVSIPSGAKQTVSFTVEVTKSANTGERNCRFSANLKDAGGADLSNQKTLEESTTFTVYERLSTDNRDSKTVAGVDIFHSVEPAGGFVQGNGNKLKIEVYNFGNTTIKNAVVSLTLPEGLSIYNGSNQEQLGYVSVGTRKTVEFPITVKEGVESKNYAIEVEVLGLNYMNGDVAAKKTFYIPVEGSGNVSTDNIAITNVNIPDEVNSGTPFNLAFTVQNTGASEIKNVKVSVEPAEGIINKSRNIFIDNIPKGGSKQYNVKLYSFDGADQKSYPIKIIASPTNAATSEKDTVSGVTQYATVTILSDGSTAKKPQLMIDNYSYGGSVVQAGTDFYLNLGLFNTSGKTLSNVKVSLTNEDGVFVPVGGSNSFFIDSIKAKGHYTKSIRLSTKPQAEQKTTPITVKMTYEAGSGDPLEADDVIAIPVTQRTRLVVDELVPPTEVYVGQQGTCELEFYNMGKTVLSNLRVNCEGDFDVMESNSYYAGNVESGKSDSYRFNFVPKAVGPMKGTITFTYEDSNGEPQFLEVPFTFEVMEAPVYDEENPEDVQPEKQKPWALIIAGGVIAVGIVGGVLFKKHRKKKLNAALEIEDDFDIDIAEPVGGSKKPESK